MLKFIQNQTKLLKQKQRNRDFVFFFKQTKMKQRILEVFQMLILVQISLQQFSDNIDLEEIYNQHLFDLDAPLDQTTTNPLNALFDQDSLSLLRKTIEPSLNFYPIQSDSQETFNNNNLFSEFPK